MPNKWVLNASPLIVMVRINHLFLLQRLAEEIVVPAGVAKEIAQGPGDDPAREWLKADGQVWVREVEVVPPVIIAWNLGLGESEVLAWAYQNPGYEAVLDDRHPSGKSFWGQRLVRIGGLKTSAPPPGSNPRPASFEALRVSTMDNPAVSTKCAISTHVKACRCTPGRRALGPWSISK